MFSLTTLQTKRAQVGLSLRELSKQTGIDTAILNKIENGLRVPTEQQISQLKSALKLSDSEVRALENLRNVRETHIPISSDDLTKFNNEGGDNAMPDFTQVSPKNPELQINVPADVKVLYSDAIFFTINDYGIVLDFAQSMGTTNQRNVVTRIGLSKKHAQDLINKLSGLLQTDLKKEKESKKEKN